ncbi:MAG TPA: hypothetical protein VEC35_16845 [Noviherbaspirillum sp.]|nr:hypothetical protein [Noviherbaspirillum sp.]
MDIETQMRRRGEFPRTARRGTVMSAGYSTATSRLSSQIESKMKGIRKADDRKPSIFTFAESQFKTA